MNNQYIEEITENILIQSNQFHKCMDLVGVAQHLKLEVKELLLEDDISGFIAIGGKIGKIGINSRNSDVRKRFTIAHEIGHFVLHSSTNPMFIEKNLSSNTYTHFRNLNSSTGEYRLEREANAFAAALLMPKKLISIEIERYFENQESREINDYMAKEFKVSIQAMSIRLSKLDIFDYGVEF